MLEELARDVRQRARLADEDLPLSPAIAERLLGPRSVVLVPRLHVDGALQRRGTRDYRILVRPDRPDLNFTVAHELGHWALRTIARFRGPIAEEEQMANYLAAAILAPPVMVRRAHAQWGDSARGLRMISRAFGLSQTSTVLRLAEVRGDERAVVTRSGFVFVRSRGGYPWDGAPVVRIARGRHQTAGVVRTRLHGGVDDGRVALRALLAAHG